MSSTRVNEIDLLRFFAALSVVFFHYSFRGFAADAMSVMPYPLLAPVSKYGYLGVELFFMISGFVILMTAESGNLRRFLISRFVRLYPTFWACCTITFAVTIIIGEPRYSASVGQYLVNMTMLSGFFGIPSIDSVYWSLFVEMKFYALVAAVLIIGRIHQAQFFLVFWLVASFALEFFPIGALRSLLIVDYSAFFIAGAMCFLIWSQGVSRIGVTVIALSWSLAIFQSLNALTSYEKHYNVKFSSSIVAGIITAFFVVTLLVSLRRTGVFGRKSWLIAGGLTYPLYLLHQQIGFMVFNFAYPTVNAHFLFWGTTTAVLLAAFAVYIFIDKRFSIPIKNAINNLVDQIERLMFKLNAAH
jgi:peptidoglycan/LPS O-acetylase OafA/YrhL